MIINLGGIHEVSTVFAVFPSFHAMMGGDNFLEFFKVWEIYRR